MPLATASTGIPASSFFEIVWACICLYLIFSRLYSWINKFLNPPRSKRLHNPIRDTRNAREIKIRRRIEECAYVSDWLVNQIDKFPMRQMGPEPKLGISIYDFCNMSDGTLILLFDGIEIFEVQVRAGASIEVELKSGEYELLIIESGEKYKDKRMLPPLYRRMFIEGTYHDQVIVGDGAERTCPGMHSSIRRVDL